MNVGVNERAGLQNRGRGGGRPGCKASHFGTTHKHEGFCNRGLVALHCRENGRVLRENAEALKICGGAVSRDSRPSLQSPKRIMAQKFMETVTTPSVMAAQERCYGRHARPGPAAERDPLTDEERD